MRKLLHGQSIRIQDIGCCGSSTEGNFGTGDLSISSRNVYDNWAIDLGKIYFADPSESQRLDAETTPTFSKDGRAATNVNRRLSKIQAEYITKLVCNALNMELKGIVPSDEEILQLNTRIK